MLKLGAHHGISLSKAFRGIIQGSNNKFQRISEVLCSASWGKPFTVSILIPTYRIWFSVFISTSSSQTFQEYWSIILNELSVNFIMKPKCILDTSNKSKHGGTWLPGSTLNIADCCLQPNNYLKKQDDSIAIIWRDESCDDSDVEFMTLKQLREQVMYALSNLTWSSLFTFICRDTAIVP